MVGSSGSYSDGTHADDVDDAVSDGVVSDSPRNARVWSPTPYDPSDYGPVVDWANDFDHADDNYNENAPEIWAALVESGCPVARSSRYGGLKVPLTRELITEVIYDPDRFSSRSVLVTHTRPGDLSGPIPIGIAPPITSDPPFHAFVRRLLLRPFSPHAIDALRPEVVSLCESLAAAAAARARSGHVVDAAADYAQHVPPAVIAGMLGFPPEDADVFRGFVHTLLESGPTDPEQRERDLEPLRNYIEAQIADHERVPRDDLCSFLLSVTFDGEPLDRRHVLGMIVLLLVAGIDTTWSAIGSALAHLASHPDDLDRYREDPDVRDAAIEEFLRFYAPVSLARLATTDTELGGCPVGEHDWVLLPFGAANRDPELVENPDRFVIDRERNRHAAFGLGPHRCLGSNLARLELRAAVDAWVREFERFELAGDVVWSSGQIRGPRSVPVRVVAAT